MPATTRDALLITAEKEWDKLTKALSQVPSDVALVKDADGISIKDVVGHRAHWIDLFLGWYRDGQTGVEVHFPAPGYKWSELKAYNAKLRADQAGLCWDAACDLLADRHAALHGFITALDNDALYGGPMKGARNTWTTGRWAEAAGASHYRSATKYIRSRLRAMA